MAPYATSNEIVMDEDQDWEIISTPEEPHSGINPYLHFQLDSWLGRFSLTVHSTTSQTYHEPQPPAEKQQETPEPFVHEQQQSPLFKLPAELRLHIYSLLFRIPTDGPGVRVLKSNDHESVLTSLLACRRFRNEAEALFYQINRMIVHDSEILPSLGDRRRAAITKMTLPARSASSLLALLQHLPDRVPNLKSLHAVRSTSIKYIDHREWAVMAPQVISEIERMEALEEVKFITPETGELSEHDITREQKLFQIDERICRAVRRLPCPTDSRTATGSKDQSEAQ